MYMEEEYTEEVRIAVENSVEYLAEVDKEAVIDFLEALGENLFEGGLLLEQLSKALRDVSEGY